MGISIWKNAFSIIPRMFHKWERHLWMAGVKRKTMCKGMEILSLSGKIYTWELLVWKAFIDTKGASNIWRTNHGELTMIAGPRPPWRKHGREAFPIEKVGVVAFSELESFIIGRDVCVCKCFIMSLFVRFQPEWNQTESDRIKPYTSLWHNMPCGFFFLMVHFYFSLVIPIKLGQHPRGQGREDLPSVELNSCGRQKSSGMVIATGMVWTVTDRL